MNRVPLHSVLDFGIVAPGRSGAQVLAESFELASRVERLGYHRLWLSEHHEAHFCWTAPETMVAALAQRTKYLRIGTAAVLLPLRNPLLLAETYRTLEALTPGRIDLGVCAGVPTDREALTCLTENQSADVRALIAGFGAKLKELMALLHGDFPLGHRFAGGVTPQFVAPPPVWVMGSSAPSAATAAAAGTHYAYSLFHRGSKLDPAVTMSFRDTHPDGRVAIAASCICAATTARAQAQRSLIEGWLKDDMRVVIAGTPGECREQVESLARRFAADEVILLHLWHEQAPRLDALDALAELFRADATMVTI
jgi:luciferase family oxidoreductase group 1